MSAQFSGLVVGGPAAGWRVSCQGDRWNVAVPALTPGYRDLSAAREKVRAELLIYQWVEGIAFGQGSIVNFWVPIGKDVIWAIQQLCSTYEEACSAK